MPSQSMIEDPDRYAMDALAADPAGVITHYRRTFGISRATEITSEMIALHWRVEREGTAAVKESTPETRAAVVDRAYSAVYSRCPWLNAAGTVYGHPDARFGHFRSLLGSAKRIYEVGSGKAALITWLSQRGYVCVATEITSERGKALAPDSSNIAWHVSDGINLARFELPFSYDAVISTQVLEHFHPDDLAAHLAGVRAILVPGGRYIFTTPHTYMGPTDLSRIFGLPYPVCQHLKEYRYRDLMGPLHEAGFARVRAFYTLPAPIVRRFPRLAKAWLGESYLGALLRAERVLDHLPEAIRSQVVKVLRLLMLWRPDICIVAETPPAAMEQLAAASD